MTSPRLDPTPEPDLSPARFFRTDSPDLFDKCQRFQGFLDGLRENGFYQALYRVTVDGALDHHIRVFDPVTGRQQHMICFDSNSYLHLHRHPRVVEATMRALAEVGYGTPSAQLLCGTNRTLRELEDTISDFHGRERTLVFSTGYAANLGAITGLVREHDLVVRDRLSHASIHDACRATRSRFERRYPHQDCRALERVLARAARSSRCQGKLVVTDGVFSMHGTLAPLPQLVTLARRYGAKLMVDEAHSTGILGPTGRGLEEHFGLPGSIDVLMGTFSKAPGTVGGYVTGTRDLIDYLRFFARPAMFTAALPAALCAGVTEAFRVMRDEPEHRERLWQNVRQLVAGLGQAGFDVAPAQSPIVTVPLGSEKLLLFFSRDLFQAGVKAGNVAYPAVPRGEAILRLTVNTRHTPEDLDRTVEILRRLAARYGILGRPAAEIRAIGDRLSLPRRAA
jgi:4-hydroxy-2,2'-bipyrrole-5-methanol synthase